MSARDTYNATIAAAALAHAAARAAAFTVHQTTIDASNSVVGYNLQSGNYANLLSSVKTANAAKLEAFAAAERAKQASHAAARDTLRATGSDNAAF